MERNFVRFTGSLIFLIASICSAFSPTPTPNWVLQGNIWRNGTTGQIYYGVYPPGVNTFTPTKTNTPTNTFTNTFTPTPTPTSTNTFTPTFTPTPTWTVQSYNPNAVATFVGGLFTGAGSAFTATPTWTFTPTWTPTNTPTNTPTPISNSVNTYNVVLTGKSLGAGSAQAATISSNVCTVTHTSHGYAQGDLIVVTGSPTGGGTFNLLYTITSVATNTYTFATSGLSNGPVTSNTEMFWFKGTRCTNPTLVKNLSRSGTGVYQLTFTNTQADTYYGISGFGCTSTTGLAMDLSNNSNQVPTTTTWGMNFINDATSGDTTGYMILSMSGII